MVQDLGFYEFINFTVNFFFDMLYSFYCLFGVGYVVDLASDTLHSMRINGGIDEN